MKMKLNQLKVQSFVTQTQSGGSELKGGSIGSLETYQAGCDTSPILCNIQTLNCPTFLC
jgi:hypothetical protein